MACESFDVSYARLKQAQIKLGYRMPKEHVNGNAVAIHSDNEVDRLLAEIGPDRIWRALDRMTQPMRPLVAEATL